MKEPANKTKCTSKLTQWHPLPVTIPCYKPMLCQSLFRKVPYPQENLWQMWIFTQPWGMVTPGKATK